ncbi:MAG TPA: cation diffusion facilitator family transporter [Myxococcota bacterium]|jgi:cobalt-zinc-cadmium efflux system protein
MSHDHDHGHDHDHPGHGHGHGHGHDHDHARPHRHGQNAGRRALGVALVLALVLMTVEVAVGLWDGSLVLLSDAAHVLTDALSLVVAFTAATLRVRPSGGRSTFGMRRLPVLGGLINGVLVLVASALIVTEAVHRIGVPHTVDGVPVICVGVLGLVINLGGAWLMHRSGDRSVNLRGAMLHNLGDALGSLAALVSGLVLATLGYALVDPIASIIVAAIISVGALRLLLDVGSILLERAPPHVDVKVVETMAKALPGVDAVVGLHAWELDSGEAVASLVLVTRETDLVRLARAADDLRDALMKKFSIAHTTIEWRPMDSPRPCCEPLDVEHEHGHLHEHAA